MKARGWITAAACAVLALVACSKSNDNDQGGTTATSATPTPMPMPSATGATGADAIALVGGGTANKIWIFDAKTRQLVTSIWGSGNDGRNEQRIAGPHEWNYPDLHDTHAVCVPKNFSKIYTANWFSYSESSYALEFDPGTLQETRRVQVGRGGHHCAVSPDDKYLYVANQYGTTVSVIDTATFTKVTDLEVGGQAAYPTPTMYWDGQTIPTPYIFATVGGPAPVSNTQAGSGATLNAVVAIDWKTNTVVKTIPIGTAIHGVNLTPDGKEVWVAQVGGESTKGGTPGTGDFTVIDVATLAITHRVKMGAGGIHIVFDRDNKYGFVTGLDGKLYKIDRSNYSVVWSVMTDSSGAHLGVTPDNKEVWTLNHGMNPERYPYVLGGLAVTGVQVFSTDDGHLIAEMPTEAVSHEIQFVPRATFGKTTATAGNGTSPGSGNDVTGTHGATVYAANCASCHGSTGGGGMGMPAINGGKWLNDSAGVAQIVTNGAPGMPAFKNVLSAQDIQDVSDWVAKMHR